MFTQLSILDFFTSIFRMIFCHVHTSPILNH